MTSHTSHISKLASSIATSTQLIDAYLIENALPQPSFDECGPTTLQLPPELEKCRQELLSSSQELQELLKTPSELLQSHQHNSIVYLKFISQFNIVKHVPLHGNITYTDLAAKINVNGEILTRILRFAIVHRVFNEPSPGVVGHSAASRLLREDSAISDWFSFNTEDMSPSAERTVDALIKWPAGSEPNQTGFSLANNTESSFFNELSRDPERTRRFAGSMSLFLSSPAFSTRHLVEGYPWSALGDAVVVDIGGSHGNIAQALAHSFPKLRLIVQDLPSVVAEVVLQPDSRIEFMAHDFFDQQPVKNADVYLLRWVLHDWPDEYNIKLLRAQIPALKKGASVVVMEFVMPPPGAVPNSVERKLRSIDITMLEIGNAKERTLLEWKNLFRQADERFAFQSIEQPHESRLSILEFTWDV